ncbi:MAG: Membrane protein insertase YidC [Fimbriimonadaceae bacterium]|nr:Membrane protein insertase YidC [Fimbriimonadaceae bacterium]
MSRPQPRGNFLQTLLLFTVIFLGFQLIVGPMQQKPDSRSSQELLQEVQNLHRKGMDYSIVSAANTYKSKVEQELKDKKAPASEIERAKLKADILVADAQFKAGLWRKDWNRLNLAYTTLYSLHKRYQGDPIWKEKIDVAPTRQRPATTITPESLWNDVVTTLSSQSRDHRVLDLIPGYHFIDALVAVTGRVPAFSYAFAALLLAMIVRALVWPLAQKQLMASRQMMQLQPLTKELRETLTNKKTGQVDQQELSAKTMELYREYGINPFSGCLPGLLQVPLFLVVYQCMLLYKFEFQKGTFLWINPGTAANTNGFVAPNLGETDWILLVIYGVSMIASTMLAPISDPANARQQRIIGISMAVVFTVFMFFWPALPSAFVLYWIFTNLLSMAQAFRAYRLAIPPLQKVTTATGGAYPQSKFMKMMQKYQEEAERAQTKPSTNGHAPGNGKANPSSTIFRGTGGPRVQKPKKKK